MKKSLFLLGLLATTLCLTACGSKNFNMSFEEAVETANHSAFQDILSSNENFQQSLDLATNFDNWWNKLALSLQSNSKQNLENSKSESNTKFDVNVDGEGSNLKINWVLDIKFIDNVIYLNLDSLNLTGSEDVSMIAMMSEGFKNQWFSIPMDWLGEMSDAFSIFKDSKELNEKAKDIILNDGSVVYNWKFAQFNWYNAWKFSLDNEKLNALIKEYYDTMDTDEEEPIEIPELNIQNFEWYLVITWKDKVTTVIDNMDIVDWEITVNINGFWGEDYEINASSEWESILTFVANKKNSNYDISLNLNNSLLLNGTLSTKVSSSKINVDFDALLTLKAEYEETDDTIVPLKGSWSYNAISEFSVEAPESAQDLTEMLQGYLWSMLWGDDYSDYEDGDYEDMDYSDYEDYEEVVDEASEEVEVPLEAPVEELTESVEENA